MRKAFGLLFATSLLIPIGMLSMAPAGAVAGTTCSAFKATITNTPGLAKVGVTAKANVTVKLVGALTGCVGGGVTKAAITQTYKYNGNCTTFITGKGGTTTPAVPVATFKWSNGKTSTATSTTKLLTKPGATPAKLTLSTKITAGLFVGAKSTGTVTLAAPTGSCGSIPGSKATLTGGKAVFK